MNKVNKVGKVVLILLLLMGFVSTALAATPLNAKLVVEGTTTPSATSIVTHNGNVASGYPVKFWFVDQSTGDNLTGSPCSFNFGDGSSNVTTQQNGEISHNYTVPGTYTVNDTVTNGTGNISLASVQVQILAQNIAPLNTAPIADFTFSPSTPVDAPVSIQFQNNTNPNGTTGITLVWTFGDGSLPSNAISPLHTYGVGNHLVTLTATGTSDTGSSVSNTISKYVNTTGIVTDFTYSVPNAQNPLTVNFQDTSVGFGKTPNAWAWDFDNDGDFEYFTEDTQYTFPAAGTYNVSHSAGVGAYSNVTYKSVTVSGTNANPNVVSFTIFPSSTGNAPFLVYFNATASTGSISKLHWDFGDGNTIDSTNKDSTVVDYYTAANTYPVNLTVTYNDASTKSLVQNVIVTNNVITKLVKADFSANPTSGVHPLTVQFTDNSTNVNERFWNFGDGASSNQTSPSHVYLTPGNFTASLIVLNSELFNN